MEYLGNMSLLELPKTAFLASSTIPVEMVLGCYDWAVKMRNEGRCIISGFSSRLEKDVWDFLVDGKHPIILVLAREMYRKIPQELQSLLDADRLLIISITKAVRQSKSTAQARNKYICELADDIMFIGATPQSRLYELSNQFKSKVLFL